MINTNKLANFLLCNSKFKLPLGNSHYITSKELYGFKNITEIERSLNVLSCNVKTICSSLFHK